MPDLVASPSQPQQQQQQQWHGQEQQYWHQGQQLGPALLPAPNSALMNSPGEEWHPSGNGRKHGKQSAVAPVRVRATTP